MILSNNGIGRVISLLNRYDSTLMSYVAWDGTGGGAGGSTQVTIARVLDSSNGSIAFGDSVNAALRVNVVAGAAGGSTIVSVSTLAGRVTVAPTDTNWASSAGFHFDGSGNLNIAGTFSASTTVNVSSLAGKVTVDQISTVWQVQINGNSTSIQGTNPWTIAGNCTVAPLAGSTWNVRALNSSAADLQMTATPVAGSTWNTRPIQSSAADMQVTATQSAAVWTFNVGTHIQSTAAPSSNSSGVVVRTIVDNILNVVSSNAFTSTSLTIQSSAASIRSYVTSYSILTTNAGPTKVKFYSGSTLLWPMIFAAVSSAVSGANLAVSAPAYLFRTKTAGPLTLQLGGGGSTVAGWHVAVSYFRAP